MSEQCRLESMSERFTVKAQDFEGPLEILLNMIEERKLSISEVSLANLCDAYLAYIEKLPHLPLGETAQFILIASTLLLIKSRSLLPSLQLSEEERESVEELERRLARLTIVRKAARSLRREWGRAPLSLAQSVPDGPVVFSAGEATGERLLAAAQRLLQMLPKPALMAEAAVAPIRALEEVIVEIRARLSNAIKASFRELTKKASREEAIIYFLAMLELVRAGSASVTQERLFEDITIELESAGVPQYGV